MLEGEVEGVILACLLKVVGVEEIVSIDVDFVLGIAPGSMHLGLH